MMSDEGTGDRREAANGSEVMSPLYILERVGTIIAPLIGFSDAMPMPSTAWSKACSPGEPSRWCTVLNL